MARVWAEAVGCKVSLADAEALQAGLVAAGHAAAPSSAAADIAVVTTCCVTAEAERSSRQRVRRLAARGLPVVVTGCAARFRAEQFTADGVLTSSREGVPVAVATLLARPGTAVGAAVRDEAAGRIAGDGRSPVGTDAEPPGHDTVTPPAAGRRTRAVLKVQDGCTSVCAYCAVRLVRGAPWSLPLPGALDAARAAVRAGCGELVISGINLGSYAGRRAAPAAGAGRIATDPRKADLADLADLVPALADLPGLQRLRLSSLEPLHVDEKLLQALAHPRVARHLHIPLQSADDGVLADMGRPYTFARYQETLAAVRETLPGTMISTDVIVGFPTESTAAFDRTLAAIGADDGLFGRVHVFTYSPRTGTPAACLTPLPAAELRRRRSAALAAAAAAQEAAADRLVGSVVEVLLEDRRDGCWRGYSSEYARCRVTGQGHSGALVSAAAIRRRGAELLCEIV